MVYIAIPVIIVGLLALLNALHSSRNCVMHSWSKWTEILTDGAITTHTHDKQLKFQRRACERCGLIQRRNL